MHLAHSRPAPITHPAPTFDGLREVLATPPPDDGALINAASLRCQRGGRERTGAECLSCSRIVSVKPVRERRAIRIRCLWTERDAVADVMTHAVAAVTVEASDTLGRADEIAVREQAHHLIVVDRGEVVGVICRCDLADPGSPAAEETVASSMDRDLWTVPPTTSLGAAWDAMDRLDLGILLVADGRELLGVVTVRDLGNIERGHGP